VGHAARFRASFPRGATLGIDCLMQSTDWESRVSNNAKNGTSAARGPTHPEDSNFDSRWGCGWINPKSEIRNPKFSVPLFHEIRRVDTLSVLSDLEVEVWSGGFSGGTDGCDHGTLLDLLTLAHRQ